MTRCAILVYLGFREDAAPPPCSRLIFADEAGFPWREGRAGVSFQR